MTTEYNRVLISAISKVEAESIVQILVETRLVAGGMVTQDETPIISLF